MQRRTPRRKDSGLDRRKRRFEDRDRRIQEVATALFVERGLGGFSMEDVASAIDYSKGTVYLHYTSKEDVLVAVLVRHLEEAAALVERAAALPVCTRARVSALAEIELRHSIRHPETVQISTTFIVPAVLAKASPGRAQAVAAAYARTNAADRAIVAEAIGRGDLVLPPETRPDSVAYALSAMLFGSIYIASQGTPSRYFTLEQMGPRIRSNVQLVLDGYRWKPLSGTPELAADVARAVDALFGAGAGAGAAPGAGTP